MGITSVKMSANSIEFLLSGSIFGHFQCTANFFYLKGLTILDYNKRILKDIYTLSLMQRGSPSLK